MSHQLQRIPRHIAAAMAVAALAAPTALAADDLRSPDARDAAASAVAAAAAQVDLRSPDTQDVAAAIRATSNPRTGDLRSPDTRDRAAGRLGPGTTGDVEITVHRPGGFDWSDAGIGAAAGAGLVLLLAGASLLVRVARTEARPT